MAGKKKVGAKKPEVAPKKRKKQWYKVEFWVQVEQDDTDDAPFDAESRLRSDIGNTFDVVTEYGEGNVKYLKFTDLGAQPEEHED